MNRTSFRSDESPLWRAALPLLLIGVAAFVVAFVVARDLNHAGFGRLPLWGLFAAAGAVVTGGGVTVLVAGREPEDATPFYDPRLYVLVPRERYDHLLERLASARVPAVARPAREGPSDAEPPWSEAEPAPRRGSRPPASTARPAPSRARAAPRSAFSPSPEFLPQVDAAIGEMEQLLSELREQGAQEARILGTEPPRSAPRPASAPAAPLPATQGPRPPAGRVPPPSAPSPAVSVSPRVSRAPVPSPPAPKAPDRSSAVLDACATCGHALPVPSKARRCSVCGGPLCAACLGRARRAGHPEVCSRCSALLPKSDREDRPARPPARKSR